MKIGIFDSGLGGLIISATMLKELPEYSFHFLGDTARVPYGNRSAQAVYDFTKQGIDYLFRNNCQMVIVACNTASAEAVKRLQHEYLPKHFPDRRILGVLVPAAEEAAARTKSGRIGVIATAGTVASQTYIREIHAKKRDAQVIQQAAPLLVPLVENNGLEWAGPILESYLNPLLKEDIDTLVLGCTHYPALRAQINEIVGADIAVISQDEIMPDKLRAYLKKHADIDQALDKTYDDIFELTDLTDQHRQFADMIMGQEIELNQVAL